MTEPVQVEPRALAKRLSRAGLSLAAVALALWIIWNERTEVASALDLELVALLSLVGAQCLYLATQSVRLRLILEHHANTRVSRRQWAKVFYVGRLLNSVFAQSGNAYRLVYLRRAYGVSAGQYASSLAAQSWIAASISLIAATALAAVTVDALNATHAPIGWLALLTLVVIAAPFLAQAVNMRVSRGKTRKMLTSLGGVFERVTATVRDRRLTQALLLYHVIGFAAGAAILMLAFSSTGHTLPIFAAAAMLSFLQAGNVVAITPGNLGIQELGLAALSGLAGYPPSSGVLASALVRVSGLLAVALASTTSVMLSRDQASPDPP